MFSRIERWGSRACRRSAGTSTTPLRMTSNGCEALTVGPSMRELAAVGLAVAGEDVEEELLALALERGEPEHLARARRRG